MSWRPCCQSILSRYSYWNPSPWLENHWTPSNSLSDSSLRQFAHPTCWYWCRTSSDPYLQSLNAHWYLQVCITNSLRLEAAYYLHSRPFHHHLPFKQTLFSLFQYLQEILEFVGLNLPFGSWWYDGRSVVSSQAHWGMNNMNWSFQAVPAQDWQQFS